MNLRKAVLLAVTALAITPIAHAQIGVYGTVTVNRLSGIKDSPDAPTSGNPSGCTADLPGLSPDCVKNSVDPLGGGGGIYYDFKKFGPIRLGADIRGTITNSKQGAYADARGSGTRIYSTLGGIRAVVHTPLPFIRPYIQGSVGLARSDYGLFTNGAVVIHNNVQYEGFAGVDIKVLPIVDFRAVELGYGALTGGSHTYPIGTISSGVVFHLPF